MFFKVISGFVVAGIFLYYVFKPDENANNTTNQIPEDDSPKSKKYSKKHHNKTPEKRKKNKKRQPTHFGSHIIMVEGEKDNRHVIVLAETYYPAERSNDIKNQMELEEDIVYHHYSLTDEADDIDSMGETLVSSRVYSEYSSDRGTEKYNWYIKKK